jgi:Methyltransferase domain
LHAAPHPALDDRHDRGQRCSICQLLGVAVDRDVSRSKLVLWRLLVVARRSPESREIRIDSRGGLRRRLFTRRLASRSATLVACDISREAVRRAEHNCRAFDHVRFSARDIRDGFPTDTFDMCVFSDVLCYLAESEIALILSNLRSHVSQGGHMMFANEWLFAATQA